VTRAHDARAALVEWPAPGRSVYFDAEPRLGWLHELVQRACSAGTPIPWTAVTGLVDSFVGPDRDAGLRTLQRPGIDQAQRNLRSLDLRNAVLRELMSYDPASTFVPREAPRPSGTAARVGVRSDMDRRVRTAWVGE
jgi:hypothetical protein